MENLHDLFKPSTDTALTASALSLRFQELSEQQPNLRRRDIADKLDVPEAALIDQQCGLRSVRLLPEFADIINFLPRLGYIMTLTRNESAVHERKGCYENVSVKGPMGLVIANDRKIDLRIIVSRWSSGYAVQEKVAQGFRYSLQFFDTAGMAIQKIFLQEQSDALAYQELVESYVFKDAEVASYTPIDESVEYVESTSVDRQALMGDWQKMTNVHQFFGMLKKYKVSREQAFSIVAAPLAQKFDQSLLEDFLQKIAATDLSIMCFVGNRGNIQIHTGAIDTIKTVGPWLNILDPEFNLHLLIDNVATGWVVRKPTEDGDVTSVELYDKEGETIAQFFGQRVEGNPENSQWRGFVNDLLEQSESLKASVA
jgi:putative hemin transport protein